MIGFKVIDTNKYAKSALVDNKDYVLEQDGRLLRVSYEDRTGEIETYRVGKRYKAVPSITIDGVEYYHGMVCRLKSSIEYIIKFGEFTISAGVFSSTTFGWHVIPSINNNTMPLMAKGLTEVGNVWQPEHRHLLPLLEV